MPLPDELIAAMREHCRENDEFSLSLFDDEWRDRLSYHDRTGPPPGAEGTFDAYELMAAVADEFEFVEDGWDSFLIDPKDEDDESELEEWDETAEDEDEESW